MIISKFHYFKTILVILFIMYLYLLGLGFKEHICQKLISFQLKKFFNVIETLKIQFKLFCRQ